MPGSRKPSSVDDLTDDIAALSIGSKPSNGRSGKSTEDGKPGTPQSGRAPPKDRTPLGMKAWRPELNILKDSSLASLATWWKATQPRNIIVMTGAGISTSAGIPDFRSPGTGLYSNLEKYDLPTPESIFEINYFRRRPEAFFTLARELFPGQFKPTLSHYFIRLLHEKGLLLRNYTQNIDTLERVAGLPAETLVEAHGSFADAKCVGGYYDPNDTTPEPPSRPSSSSSRRRRSDGRNSLLAQLLGIDDDADPRRNRKGCGTPYSTEWVRQRVFREEVPVCPKCDGLVKPNIVFFGESLPERFHSLLVEDFPKCDLLVVMGTSLQVAPFNTLINFVGETVPRLLINREEVGTHGEYGSRSAGFDFTGQYQEYRRDAVHLATVDEGVRELSRLMGWEEELMELHRAEHSRLEAEWARGNRAVNFEKAETAEMSSLESAAGEQQFVDAKEQQSQGSDVEAELEKLSLNEPVQTPGVESASRPAPLSMPPPASTNPPPVVHPSSELPPAASSVTLSTATQAYVYKPPRGEVITSGGVVVDLDAGGDWGTGELRQLDEEEQAVVDALRAMKEARG